MKRPVSAGLTAAIVSGAPSTVWALVDRDDTLAAVRAAGTLLPGRRRRPSVLGGVVAHVVVSSFWTTVFALAARRCRLTTFRGALAGLGIAALDLGVIGRRYPAIAALDSRSQVADHVLFGAVLGHFLARSSMDRP
jgi:hypothetical protein